MVLFVPLNGTTTPKHVNEVRLHNLNGLVSASWNLEGELPSKLGESSVQLGSILEESGRDSTNYHGRMIQLGYLNVRTEITHSRSAGKATASRPMTVCGTQRRGKGLVPMSTNESLFGANVCRLHSYDRSSYNVRVSIQFGMSELSRSFRRHAAEKHSHLKQRDNLFRAYKA